MIHFSQFGFFSPWNALYFALLVVTPRRKIFNGCLTRPVRRGWLRKHTADSFDWIGLGIRTVQVVVISVPIGFFVTDHTSQVVNWIVIIVFLMDDYLTGDDDRWKRIKQWVRNKLKWRMKLPVLNPESSVS